METSRYLGSLATSKVTTTAAKQDARLCRTSERRSNQIGDLYVQLDIETPQNLSKRQRELLEEFAKLETSDTSPTSGGFFDKLKKMFEA